MRVRLAAATVLPILLGVATPLHGQTPPSLGSEFQVNTYTSASETGPAVACNPDGSFVVTWTDNQEDGSDFGVFGQRFDAVGLKAGGEFRVNSYTTGYQWFPSVASDAQGNFVVVWYGVGAGSTSATDYSIFGKRYNAAGAPIGSDFIVNTFTGGNVFGGDVAAAAAGNFVVVWTAKDEVSDYDVFGQRFSSAGAKVGSEFLVNTYTPGRQIGGRVALDRSGGFVVVWSSVDQDGSGTGVFGQRFNASAQKVGPEFQVNTYTTGYQDGARVAVDRGGNFVVVWSEDAGGGPDRNVVGQRFVGSGTKVGPQFQVNTSTGSLYGSPGLTMDPSGDFLVAWTGADADGRGVLGQRFDRGGNRLGTEFAINAYTTDNQVSGGACDAGRGFVVTWFSHEQNDAGYGVFGRRQRFHPDGLAVDVHGIGTSDLNGVLEPGEAAVVEPHWTNEGGGVHGLNGTTAAVIGPAGPTYTLLDGQAAYGDILFGIQTDCNAVGDCYAVQIGGSRPATHWDAEFQEDLDIGGSQVWKLHLGDSFTDVPRSEPFYKKIETMLHNGITTGCNATQYCPGTVVSRDAMAIFIAKGIAGLGGLVPSTGLVGASAYDCSLGGHSLFTDVSPTDAFCKHVHYLAAQNVTLGCNATQYCPGQTITRDAMASFIAKAIVAPAGGNGVPVSYTDPATSRSYSCVSGSANLHFTDVPVSNAFCKHIHYLWARGVVDGCTATKYCPSSPVARDAMAKFIANGFGLQLYGP
jgi:hypothetical protein